MKLRGLSNLTILVAAASILVGFYFYQKRSKVAPGLGPKDDIKSQLTAVTKPKNLKEIIANNLKKQEEFVERKDFEPSSVTLERAYTENEINNMTEAQFASLLKDTEFKLPKLSDIKKIPEGALHHVPAPVMQAGKDLGLIKEILNVHESYETQALVFYESCAKNAERPTPVRALCLTNVIGIKKNKGEKINLAAYPKELVNLTRMVTDL